MNLRILLIFALFFVFVNGESENEGNGQRVGRAGVPRFQGTRNRKRIHKKPSRLGEPIADKRQDNGPGLNISSVSPIELSLGGLTGLQGLPPLSIIQLVKVLVAITPFIIPLVFVPLLIFTIGMFMIPVKNSNLFIGDELKRSFDFIPSITRNLVTHEECLERLCCEIEKRYFTEHKVIERLTDNHPTFRRISKSIVSQEECTLKRCSLVSFVMKLFN